MCEGRNFLGFVVKLGNSLHRRLVRITEQVEAVRTFMNNIRMNLLHHLRCISLGNATERDNHNVVLVRVGPLLVMAPDDPSADIGEVDFGSPYLPRWRYQPGCLNQDMTDQPFSFLTMGLGPKALAMIWRPKQIPKILILGMSSATLIRNPASLKIHVESLSASSSNDPEMTKASMFSRSASDGYWRLCTTSYACVLNFISLGMRGSNRLWSTSVHCQCRY